MKLKICISFTLALTLMQHMVADDHWTHEERTVTVEEFQARVKIPQKPIWQEMLDLAEGMALLSKQIKRAKQVLPQHAIGKMQKRTKFHIDWCNGRPLGDSDDYDDNGSGSITGQQYWITIRCYKYMANILQDAYKGGAVVGDEEVWGNPNIIIHELAHAWHDGWIEDGFENQEIKDAFESAKLYYPTEDEQGNTYYWATHHNEFFAEFTVMYFASHWAEPGSIWELRWEDQVMIEKFWELE